jgi:hypothetical protein
MNTTSNKNFYKYELFNIICRWCKGNHKSRQCRVEKLIKNELKTKVGMVMEQFVEKYIQCPRCLDIVGDYCENNEEFCSFERLANNTPSLDIECKMCGLQVEVKSKCLSVNVLPNKVYCKAGNFNNLINNIYNNNLHMIVIIYSADRETKNIVIKEVLWLDNADLRYNKKIIIKKEINSSLSNIELLDRKNFTNLSFNIEKICFRAYINNITV